jgi:hypothetical protein
MKKLLFFLFMLTAFAFAAPLPSGGLGLTKTQWETKYGQPTGKGILGLMYKDYEVIFINNKIEHIELNLKNRISEKDTQIILKNLMPRDAKFLKQYSPNGTPEKRVFLYSSKWLGGQFHYQYNIYPNQFGVGRMIIGKGNNP